MFRNVSQQSAESARVLRQLASRDTRGQIRQFWVLLAPAGYWPLWAGRPGGSGASDFVRLRAVCPDGLLSAACDRVRGDVDDGTAAAVAAGVVPALCLPAAECVVVEAGCGWRERWP